MNFDTLGTTSSQDQLRTEQSAAELYCGYIEGEEPPTFDREAHVRFLHKGLTKLPAKFVTLESSRPWLLYWMVHSLALLRADPPKGLTTERVRMFLRNCQHKDGGIGGGPGQIGHLANTFAGVSAAIDWGGGAVECIDRAAVLRFLRARCVPADRGGGFEVCEGGEVDVRGCYTALAVAHMLRLDKLKLAEEGDAANYVQRCQTYEGGIGAEPGNEAHGGYTFCGLAALMLIGCADVLDIPKLLHFAVKCQGSVEGGFMGRTNKLVDGCYSFWQGGLFALLNRLGPEYLRQSKVPRPIDTRLGDMQITALEAESADHDMSDTLIIPSFPSAPALTPDQQAFHTLHRAKALKELSNLECNANESNAERSRHVNEANNAIDHAEKLDGALQDSAKVLLETLDHAANDLQVKEVDTPNLFNTDALRLWILGCCQAPNGGLRDKPGTQPDYYHTCYCLSGLSSVQHFSQSTGRDLGAPDLDKADPLCNVLVRNLESTLEALGEEQLWS